MDQQESDNRTIKSKRYKTDIWNDDNTRNQLTSSNVHLTVENKHLNDIDVGISCLEKLPDETLLEAFKHLNTVEIFKAFDGLNQRFNNLILECARHVTLPGYTSHNWIVQHMARIENVIETCYLHVIVAQAAFPNIESCPNIRSIILYGNGWKMNLNTTEISPHTAINSSVAFADENNLETFKFHARPQNYLSNYLSLLIDQQAYIDNKALTFSSVERLSIESCSTHQISTIFFQTPNLTHLKVRHLVSSLYNTRYLPIPNRTNNNVHLVELILWVVDHLSLTWFEDLINYYQSSLKRLTFGCLHIEMINGHLLEKILKRCQQLEKLTFLFQLKNTQINITDLRQSFQSRWWLDEHRPPIFINRNDSDGITIASLPCSWTDISLSNDFTKWCINRGELDSLFVRFTKMNRLNFTNNIDRPVTLEFLYSVDRIFIAPNQSLTFTNCNIGNVDILFDIFIDDPTIPPVLSRVRCLITDSNIELKPMSLIVWLLLAPNLTRLNLKSLCLFNTTELAKELAKELSDIRQNDERVVPFLDRIVQLHICGTSENIDQMTKHELFSAFEKVFTKAKIL